MVSVDGFNFEVKRSQHVLAVFEESKISFIKEVEKGAKTIQWWSNLFSLRNLLNCSECTPS